MSIRERFEGGHLKGSGTGATVAVTAAFNPTNAQQFIAVYSLILTSSAAGTVQLQDTNGNALSAAQQMVAGVPLILPVQNNNDPWFTTKDNSPGSIGAGLQFVQGTGANTIAWDMYVLGTL